MKIFLLFLTVVFFQNVYGYEIFVSTKGMDSNLGTIDAPFRTLERARTEVRKMKARQSAAAEEDITVYLREGNYILNETFKLGRFDSGSPSFRVIYRSYPREKVKIIGGVQISLSSFSRVTDPGVLSMLSERAKSKVLQFDLKGTGLRRLSVFDWKKRDPTLPCATEPTSPEELFFNDEPMVLARWPNNSWVKTGRVLSTGSIPRNGNVSNIGGEFTFSDSRMFRWKGADLWLMGYWNYKWYDEALKVKQINLSERTIKLAGAHYYGIKQDRNFYVFNEITELDQPGEYYINRKSQVVYFWPPLVKENSYVTISLLDAPLVRVTNSSNISFVGLTLEMGRGSGIVIEGGRGVVLKNMVIRNVGGTGVRIQGGYSHSLLSSALYDLGTRGVQVIGGDRPKLSSSHHLIKGNDIHHYGRRISTPNAGVEISGVGVVVEDNIIHEAPHMGIRFSGNEHLIRNNVIYSVCSETSDAGAIYTGRDWTSRGNRIEYNKIWDVRGLHGKGDVTAIYLDDFASGTTILGNEISNVNRGILVGGGRDNDIRNNIFYENTIPIHIDARGTTWAKAALKEGKTLWKKLVRMPYEEKKWVERYPYLARLLSDEPQIPKGNSFIDNILFSSGKSSISVLADKYGMIRNNMNTLVNPGFVSPEGHDFSLLNESRVKEVFPDWKSSSTLKNP